MMAASKGASSDTIPPIEIGTFVASRPDKSEFIGSSSGVFFIDTVLRAFATSDQVGDSAGAPDPRSVSSFLAAPDCQQDEDEPARELNPAPEANPSSESGRWTYGVDVPRIGNPPPPDLARSLLVQYFQIWHPLFPFIHGPTFFDQVNQFYEQSLEPGVPSRGRLDTRARICQAVTFQCIFNIAASVRGQQGLGPESQIRSPSALASLLGVLSSDVDSSSLQALIAAELYLMNIMSLRAASTIHGTLTRLVYHAGYHRCPLRYVQLPHHVCEIRKRIFWCAYILDRHRDSDVDVCIPAMIELHRPARTSDKLNTTRSAPEDEIHDHLPNHDHTRSNQERRETLEHANTPLSRSSGTAVNGSDDSPAEHHVSPARRASEYVLAYLATYSRLAGEILDLLHKSLHSREITREKILEVTTRAHAWWNSLPSALQEGHDSDAVPTEQRYDILFTLLYSNLVILINRPFLSLPLDRVDFRSCIQTALRASRDVILKTKNHSANALLMAWPGTLSITWMAGLVTAFASLLGLYPFAKASSDRDIEHCLKLLEVLGTRWASARRCHVALKTLLEKLSFQSQGVNPNGTLTPATSRQAEDGQDQSMAIDMSMVTNPDAFGVRMGKRRRLHNDGRDSLPVDEASGATAYTNPSIFPNYMPVLEYTGPDFGFDAARSYDPTTTTPQNLYNYQLDPDSGLFSNAGWDLYINNFDNGFGF